MGKKLRPIELAKLHANTFGFIGLILGILYSFGGLLVDLLVTLGIVTTNETPGLSYGTVLAFGALIGMPAIGIVFGFIAGFIIGIFYNLIPKKLKI